MKHLITISLHLLAIFLLINFPLLSDGQNLIYGKVKDKKSKETIVGANVYILGTTIGASTNLDGNYTIKNLKPGTYKLVVSCISYKSDTVTGIRVSKDKETVCNFEIEETSTMLDGVTIRERKSTSSEISMISSIKSSNLTLIGISSQQISRSQDKDASEVIRRVPGVTIIDGRFVIVRGLIERYNSVWLNNAVTPSSESDQRAFSFDVIPSSMINNILIYKTPAPELPADFAGAFIQVSTKNNPEKNELNISYSTSWNEGTSFNSFYKHKGGKYDWLGFDDGTRSLPGKVPGTETMMGELQDERDGIPQDIVEYRKEQLVKISRSFNKTSTAKKMDSPLDNKISLDYTGSFKIKNVTIGNITSVNYKNTYDKNNINRAVYESYDITGDKSTYVYKFNDAQYTNNVQAGILHNWSFIFGNNVIEFRNLLNQTGCTNTTFRQGIDHYRDDNKVKITELGYSSRFTYSGQIGGEHKFRNNLSMLNWTIGYSKAKKEEPDIRRIYYYSAKVSNDDGDTTYLPYQLDYTSMLNTESNGRLFFNTDEDNYVGNMNYQHIFSLGNFKPEIKAGFDIEDKHRDFSIRTFGIKIASTASNFNNLILYQPADSIYADTNFNYQNGIIINENTKPEYSYKADCNLSAGYLSLKIPFTSFINLYAGVRMESYRMKLWGYKAKTDTTPNITLDSINFFPSASITVNVNEKNLIRLSYGQTINRPEFREMAPYGFYDFEQSANVYGNKDIKSCYINNYDVRYEFYPSMNEMITIGAFYKKFDHPIEKNLIPASNGWDFKYVNADKATSLGAEIDIRKNLQNWEKMNNPLRYLSNLTVVFNASIIRSRVETDANYVRDKKRPMFGQSPYIINAGFYYQNKKGDLNMSLLYNIIGERIMVVGTPSTPNIYEMPRNLLDYTVMKKFGKHLQLKAGIKDIFSEDVCYQQTVKFTKDGKEEKRTQIIKKYNPGRYVSAGFTYTL